MPGRQESAGRIITKRQVTVQVCVVWAWYRIMLGYAKQVKCAALQERQQQHNLPMVSCGKAVDCKVGMSGNGKSNQ